MIYNSQPCLKNEKLPNCSIYIKPENSGKYLDVKDMSINNLSQIIIWDYHGGSN